MKKKNLLQARSQYGANRWFRPARRWEANYSWNKNISQRRSSKKLKSLCIQVNSFDSQIAKRKKWNQREYTLESHIKELNISLSVIISVHSYHPVPDTQFLSLSPPSPHNQRSLWSFMNEFWKTTSFFEVEKQKLSYNYRDDSNRIFFSLTHVFLYMIAEKKE